MEMNFCRRCGASLKNIENHVFKCENGHTIYANASPTVSVFFLDGDNVILSRRGIEPNKGTLDTIGGFLDGKESLEAGLAREVREEVGLEPSEYETPIYLCSIADTYHYGDEDNPIVSALFYSTLKTDRSLTPHDDVAEVVVRPLFDIDLNEIGNADIRAGLKILQQHVKEHL